MNSFSIYRKVDLITILGNTSPIRGTRIDGIKDLDIMYFIFFLKPMIILFFRLTDDSNSIR